MPRNYSFAQTALGMPDYFRDFTPETRNVKTPVLVITGTQDHNIGPEHYRMFRYPRKKVAVIQGGHILYYEKNREFADAVFNWISR